MPVVAALLVATVLLSLQRHRQQQVASVRAPGANVVLLLLDATRADHLPCYGYARNTTPFLCEMAAQGFIFERAISQSNWTKASVGSLFTSVYPHNHRAQGYTDVLSRRLTTLAEMLTMNGYYTVGLQANPFVMRAQNFDQGFQDYLELDATARAEELVDAFIKRVRIPDGRKFFAYFHFMDAHLPYAPPEKQRAAMDRGYKGKLSRTEFEELWAVRSGELKLDEDDRRHVVDLYDAELRYLDSQVGRLYAHLASHGLAANTIFVILADHGEELWDHGGFEHGHTMYNELLRVPLIILPPSWRSGQVRVPQLVRLIDVMPTLAGMLQLPAPRVALGVDLTEAMVTGQQLGLMGFSEATLHGLVEVQAIQTRTAKIIKAPVSDLVTFYDLASDPAEQHGSELKTPRNELLGALEAQRTRRIDLKLTAQQHPLDDRTTRALKSLGYIR